MVDSGEDRDDDDVESDLADVEAAFEAAAERMHSRTGGQVGEQGLEQVLPAARAGQAWALRVVHDDLAPRVHSYLRARGAASRRT